MAKQNKHIFYCVNEGESFFSIAQRVFGDPRDAYRLTELNPQVLKLKPGDYIFLTRECPTCKTPIAPESRALCICSVCRKPMTVFPFPKRLYGNE